MDLLPVAAPLDRFHHQIFRSDKGQVLPDGLFHDFFIDVQAVGNILRQAQNGIGAEESLGHGDPAVGRIVQGPLQPLDGSRHGGVHGVRHQVPGQRADSLAAHGVTLVSHGRRANLAAFKGFFHLPVVLQQADIICHPVAALGNGGQAVENPAVQLSGIGLAADIKAAFKSESGADAPVHLVNLLPVAVEQFQEAGFGAGGAPAAQELHAVNHKFQFFQVGGKVLHPQCCSFAYRHQLGRLVVGIAQRGHSLVGISKFRQIGQDFLQLFFQVHQALAVDHQVGIIGNVAAGSAQVDDACCVRCHFAVGVDMGHHIMAHFFFPGGGTSVVNVRQMGFQLGHLLLRHRQAQFLLCPGQGNPQPSPGQDSHIAGEKPEHIFRCVSGTQGGFIMVFHDSLLICK